MPNRHLKRGLLYGTRVYLSGPMDFVASRTAEKQYGWRNRISQFLSAMGVTVFDPWVKPEVKGLHEFGREDVTTTMAREQWTFIQNRAGAIARARTSGKFWETLHIDLRMVDTCDFVIAYCPTNVYSVGTPHEIVICRQQRKPVLFVSPRVEFENLKLLYDRLKKDKKGLSLLKRLVDDVPIKENPFGVPSLWYMPLVGPENFFDGFGFEPFRTIFKWKAAHLDKQESKSDLKHPLLSFLKRVNENQLPQRWDNRAKKFVRNDDWLLLELEGLKRIVKKSISKT